MTSRFSRALLFCGALMVCGFGCSKSSGTSTDGGHLGDGGATSVDGGAVDAGDGKCHSNAVCPDSKYCDVVSGECVPAKPCQANPAGGDSTGVNACEYQADDSNPDYCANGSCYCDLTRGGGVCLPRVAKCGTCSSDTECGNDPIIYEDYVAACATYQGAKVCLPDPPSNQSCPPGYVRSSDPTLSMYCVPAGGACGAASTCTKDTDCDPTSDKPLCDVSRGICIPACTFDHKDGSSSCPPNQVCHVDPRLLTPGSNPNLGLGRCAAPCDAASGAFTCPMGLECVSDSLNGQKRCRPPPPQCIRDADCPPNMDAHTLGYCNLDTLTCESENCVKDSQCMIGYSCQNNVCAKRSCVDEGGAIFACSRGQFCCGEAGSPDCPAGVGQGQCYDAPNPPWCGMCGADGPQKAADNLSRPQPPFCVGGTEWVSCDPNAQGGALLAQCPVEYKCSPGPMFCTTDADCGSSGKCSDLQMTIGQKMIMTKGCSCQDASTTCPSPISACGKDAMGKSTGICMAHWCDPQFCYSSLP